MERIFDWLSSLSSFLTLAFGVYGLGVEPRDETGRLTRKGKIVLAGIVVSGLVTLVNSAREAQQKEVSAQTDLKRFAKLLAAVERTTYSVKDGYISFSYSVDLTTEGVESYAKRLSETYGRRASICKEIRSDETSSFAECGDFTWSKSSLFNYDQLSFTMSSSLSPREADEYSASQILQYLGPYLTAFEKDYGDSWPTSNHGLFIAPSVVKQKILLSYGVDDIGGTEKLKVAVNGLPLSTAGIGNLGLSSLVDVLGKVVRAGSLFDQAACDIKEEEKRNTCLSSMFNARLHLDSVDVEFPHGASISLSSFSDERDIDGTKVLIKKIPEDFLDIQ